MLRSWQKAASQIVDLCFDLYYTSSMKKNNFVLQIKRTTVDLLKETPQQRAERLAGRRLTTQTVPNKKRKSRAQMKQQFHRGEY